MRIARVSAIALLVGLLAGNVQAQLATDVTQRIEITGGVAFPPDRLRDALSDATEAITLEGVTPATADDAAFFLELFYRRNGYARALVTYTILPGGRLRLTVDEGQPVLLGKIDFITGRALPESRLKEYFLAPTRNRVPANRIQLPFILSDLNAGREALVDYYVSEGFPEVVIDPLLAIPREGGRVSDVRVRIREGPRYQFGRVQIEGVPAFTEKPAPTSWFRRAILFQRPTPDTWAEVQRQIEKLRKEPFTIEGANSMARKVEEFLKRKGYYAAEVVARADRNAARQAVVPVRIVARAGVAYRIGEITVEGTDRLKPAYVRNRFGVLRGELYDPAKLDKVFQDEMKTGLYQVLRINAQPQSDGTLKLGLTVKEAKAREVGFSLGYGTFDGPIVGFEARDRDLFGTGRPLGFRAVYSTRTYTGELTYEDPHWLETENKLLLKIGVGGFKFDSYDKREVGFSAQLSRKLTREVELAGFVTGRGVNLSQVFVSPQNTGPTKYIVGSAGLTSTLDFRDSPIIPARGLAFNATVNFTQGSGSGDKFEFIRATMRLSYYIPIKKTTLAFGFRAGLIEPMSGGSSGIPIDERFFNGGATTVRSFTERRLGPRDMVTGNPIGGLAYTISNVEFNFPIRGDLHGAVFYDVGNVTRNPSFSGLRSAVGGGLRYNLPIGPLRIDYGLNPSPQPGESRGALHVSFGIAF